MAGEDFDQGTPLTSEEIAELREQNSRLQQQLTNEQNRAEAESRRAQVLEGRAVEDSRRIAQSTVDGLAAQEREAEATITSIDAEIGQLEGRYADLTAEGNFAEAAKVNTKIADASARRNQANQAKAYYGHQAAVAKAQPADPIDRFFAQSTVQFTPEEQAWIRRNPRYATDQEFNRRVNAAHAAAVEKGIQPRSAEYFAELEQGGYMRPAPQQQRTEPSDGGSPDAPFSSAATEGNVQQPTRPAPRSTAVAAPPSRRTAATSGGQRRVLDQLSPDEADAALRMYELLAPKDVKEEAAKIGDPAIYKWWSDLKNGQTAQRKREEWAQM